MKGEKFSRANKLLVKALTGNLLPSEGLPEKLASWANVFFSGKIRNCFNFNRNSVNYIPKCVCVARPVQLIMRAIYLTGNALIYLKIRNYACAHKHTTLLPLPEKGRPLIVINVLSQSLRSCMRSICSSGVERSLLHSS